MKHIRGFTLIEVLIALMIFSILSVITSTVLYTVFDARDRTNQHADRLAALQLALTIIERDIKQAVTRPITLDLTQAMPPLQGSSTRLEFTRTGVVNPLSLEKRSGMRRIAYFIQNGALVRRSWQRLDRRPSAPYEDKVILRQIERMQFAYLNDKGSMVSTWDPPMNRKEPANLPKAVQLRMTLEKWGEMILLYPIGIDFHVSKSFEKK